MGGIGMRVMPSRRPSELARRLLHLATAIDAAGISQCELEWAGADMFDEMRGSEGAVRPAYAELSHWLGEIPPDVLDFRRREAELLLPPHRHHLCGLRRPRGAGAPHSLRRHPAHPRRRPNGRSLQRGLEQRVKAINAYIKDVYGRREILKAGIVPEDLVFQNPVFRPEMNGQKVPHDIYVHIAGIDIVRVDADNFYVLEDNARTPSGVSYMLENREIMLRLFPGTVLALPRRAGRELSRTSCWRR